MFSSSVTNFFFDVVKKSMEMRKENSKNEVRSKSTKVQKYEKIGVGFSKLFPHHHIPLSRENL